MYEPHEELRQRLHRKIARLPHDKLEAVDAFVDGLQLPVATLTTANGQFPRARRAAEQGAVELLPQQRDWPRAPLHRISEQGTYFVTCGTLHKLHLFRGRERLKHLEEKLLTLASQYGWHLEAWAVFSNHYHFVGHSAPGSDALRTLIRHLHGDTARHVNELDGEQERAVWHNFWDTQLTFERSYLARLNYVHQNPVKHGLVKVANQYPYCSAAWFERTATPAQVKTIYRFKIDRVNVPDEYEPEGV